MTSLLIPKLKSVHLNSYGIKGQETPRVHEILEIGMPLFRKNLNRTWIVSLTNCCNMLYMYRNSMVQNILQ